MNKPDSVEHVRRRNPSVIDPIVERGWAGRDGSQGSNSAIAHAQGIGTSESLVRSGGTSVPVPDVGGRRILVIDDEPTVRDVLSRYLARDGFHVDAAGDGQSARRLLANHPDIVVLDLMVPGMDGLSFLREIRQASDVPVIVLTARTDEVDRIIGLELGADDYIGKPYSPRELCARVRSVLRRGRAVVPAAPLEFEGLTIDMRARTVIVCEQLVSLRAREFDLLAFLAQSPGQVFSRVQLLDHVWGTSPAFSDISTVTVHVRRIRLKIEGDPLEPRWIKTIRGIGYRFDR